MMTDCGPGNFYEVSRTLITGSDQAVELWWRILRFPIGMGPGNIVTIELKTDSTHQNKFRRTKAFYGHWT